MQKIIKQNNGLVLINSPPNQYLLEYYNHTPWSNHPTHLRKTSKSRSSQSQSCDHCLEALTPKQKQKTKT